MRRYGSATTYHRLGRQSYSQNNGGGGGGATTNIFPSGICCGCTCGWFIGTIFVLGMVVGLVVVAMTSSMQLGIDSMANTETLLKLQPSDVAAALTDTASKLAAESAASLSNLLANDASMALSQQVAEALMGGSGSGSGSGSGGNGGSNINTSQNDASVIATRSPEPKSVPTTPSPSAMPSLPPSPIPTSIPTVAPTDSVPVPDSSTAAAAAAANSDATSVAATMPQQLQLPREYPQNDGNDIGFLSALPLDYFHDLQQRIDDDDNIERCKRYHFTYPTSSIEAMNNNTRILPSNSDQQPTLRRRIFYGALMASEPWELYEIVGAETYGIFEAMVFVESNRTQDFYPRNFTHLHHADILSQIYGVPAEKIQIRSFIDENPSLRDLDREQHQRAEILNGWKELGMQPTDIAYLADADETFTRDFFRAVQVCDNIPTLDYHKHYCKYDRNGIRASTMVFETSPECVTNGRSWFHPDMFIGACIEQIGNETSNPRAPRLGQSFLRAKGYGYGGWDKVENITDNRYPLYSAADFRRIGGGKTYHVDGTLVRNKEYGSYTGYHFHNFFVKPDAIRFKYLTYGHPDRRAFEKTLEELHEDIALMVRCVKHIPDPPKEHLKRVMGGYESVPRFKPIYFHDPLYRRQRHNFIRDMVIADERDMLLKRNNTKKKQQRRQLRSITARQLSMARSRPKATRSSLFPS
jgi:hypothetical protein